MGTHPPEFQLPEKVAKAQLKSGETQDCHGGGFASETRPWQRMIEEIDICSS